METRLSRFLRTRPLAAAGIAVTLGATAGVFAPQRMLLFVLCTGLFALIAVLICLLHKPHKFAAWLCVILFLSAGYGAYSAQRPGIETIRAAEVTAVVADAPEWQADKARAVMRLSDVAVKGQALDHDVRLYAYGEVARGITIADEIAVTGTLYAPDTSGNGGFDFREYLWAEGVGQYMSMQASEISVTPCDGGWIERIAEMRTQLRQRADELFPENAAILRALMLGDRTGISDADEQAFSESGIMHLLAVSGLHVSILATVLTLLGTALCVPKPAMVGAVTVLLVFYAILCGGSPSIVRAVVMYVLLQSGNVTRRGGDPLTRLCTACALMVLYEPMYLCQTGFQLSFAAVAGLTLLLPTLQQLLPSFAKRGAAKAVSDIVLASAAAQLGALPVIVSAFGEVSWIGLLLNIICIPLAQAALVLGMIALIAGGWLPVSAVACAADSLTGWLLSVARWAADLPFGVWQIPALTLPFAFLYAIALALGGAQAKTKLRTRVIAICLLPLLVFGNAAVLRYQVATEDFSVTFLDVGQGDSALINAEGSLYLVDVGDGSVVADYIADNALDIEGIFISHAHDDHAGGLSAVLEVADPDWICLPECYYGGEADIAALTVIAQAEEAGIGLRLLSAGDMVPLSKNISAEALYPMSSPVTDGGNESSLLLRVACAEGSVLFTGDLPADCEPLQLPQCSVLKVAHHGSDGSTTSRFLASVRPTLAVISVGRGNTYGHPGGELLARLEQAGATVLRTDVHGAVTVQIDASGNVWAETYFAGD